MTYANSPTRNRSLTRKVSLQQEPILRSTMGNLRSNLPDRHQGHPARPFRSIFWLSSLFADASYYRLTCVLLIMVFPVSIVAQGKKSTLLFPLKVETKQCTHTTGGAYQPESASTPDCLPLKTQFLLSWNCNEAGKCKHRTVKSSNARGIATIKLLPGVYSLNLMYDARNSPSGGCVTTIESETTVTVKAQSKPNHIVLQKNVNCFIPSAPPWPPDKIQDTPSERE